ncbi:MAG TPA: DNA topoisomerase I [Methanotrichaceae archaeon]|nr:DNA topoisomerase I [Methanotrichaceae archaeon]HQF16330.1 DNA topoisomerase I [Methanotrichaceae archaeon]HQI90102.1 DNA topoisomerase I [Methanotrichaceae archaeon]HQJ27875.1 DNA topoisomerase I [Methanotrichaceae archaeon]
MHLIIAEKHDAAKRIAHILAGGQPKSSRVSGVETFRFGDEVVIGLSGHIVGVDFPSGYNNWQKVDFRDLIRADVVTRATQEKIISALKSLGEKADRITIATDFDREGELIGAEALDIAREANPGLKADRVRFSAITKEEISKAFSHPEEVDFDLAASGQARQVVDLVWGAALTRYISLTSGRLGKEFLSVGRVQSPTLALIVDREREINAFTPRPYWEIYADVRKGKKDDPVRVQHASGRIWERQEADRIVSVLEEMAIVRSLEKKSRKDRPPSPFDTTAFISAASGIGFSAANAMRIAETLYTNGFISYPRTDNTVYPPSIDLRALVSLFLSGPFGEDAKELMKGSLTPSRGKRSTTDHPPIYPTTLASKEELKEDQWRIYELVVRRFFATLSGECQWEITDLRVDIGPEPFKANGARMVEMGWRRYYPYSKAEERILPPLAKGDRLTVLGHEVAAKETQPPSRYGQGRLVKLMDELGLGTKSTRHDIISKLYARAYVQGNPIRPTNTAYAVVDTLQRYAPTITKPDMTRTLEKDMTRISAREVKQDEVIEESRLMLESVFSDLLGHRSEIEKSLKEGLRDDKIVGRCQTCGSDLIIRRSRRGGRFIGCSGYPDCRFTLPLPKFGTILVVDKRCEDHQMNHLRIINKGKRPWDLGCPHCNFLQWKSQKASQKPEPSLEEIEGLGPKSREKLQAAGVNKLADLSGADLSALAEKTGISLKKMLSWQKAASAMLAEKHSQQGDQAEATQG